MGVWDWLMGYPEGPKPVGKKGQTLKRRSKTRPVLSLESGDVVSYEETDYVVESRFTYSAGGFTWFDYLLFDAATDTRIWLSAEDDDGLELAIYRAVDWEIPERVGKSVNYEGKFFLLLEHGEAEVDIQGETGKQTRVEYWDFATADEKALFGIERWGGEWEASCGTPIKEYELKIYPRGDHA